jgi:arsenate reductase-like glutaredoxin family protein
MPRRMPDFTNGKHCPRCKETKPVTEYFKSNHTVHGLGVYCKPCSTERQKKWIDASDAGKAARAKRAREWRKDNPMAERRNGLKKYGLTIQEYDARLLAQGSKCAICETTEPLGRGRFHVDHCHDTGAVRGLLCHHCNLGIGNFKHRTDFLSNAISYLSTEGGSEG